jgi:hypothetical protein
MQKNDEIFAFKKIAELHTSPHHRQRPPRTELLMLATMQRSCSFSRSKQTFSKKRKFEMSTLPKAITPPLRQPQGHKIALHCSDF